MEARNVVRFDSMPPASLGIWVKLFRMWEFRTSMVEGSARRSQQTLTIWSGLPGLFGGPGGFALVLFAGDRHTCSWLSVHCLLVVSSALW
ncbi:hypothetical protein D4764_11G0000120 [Takifugu flavidus]|uniref:Uncharacterized protein n=1 Tax=Takifugu flavidus TaxID=433684 RepID=A0A5C6PGG0_9TELE|nr:hypothetical protein D4764_11G0000120 [Takifugu flavidus]